MKAFLKRITSATAECAAAFPVYQGMASAVPQRLLNTMGASAPAGIPGVNQ
jgi:hypothetical protein